MRPTLLSPNEALLLFAINVLTITVREANQESIHAIVFEQTGRDLSQSAMVGPVVAALARRGFVKVIKASSRVYLYTVTDDGMTALQNKLDGKNVIGWAAFPKPHAGRLR